MLYYEKGFLGDCLFVSCIHKIPFESRFFSINLKALD